MAYANSTRAHPAAPHAGNLPEVKITIAEHVHLWRAFLIRAAAEIAFVAGKSLFNKPYGLDWLGYWIDRAGCALHERSFAIVEGLAARWESRSPTLGGRDAAP